MLSLVGPNRDGGSITLASAMAASMLAISACTQITAQPADQPTATPDPVVQGPTLPIQPVSGFRIATGEFDLPAAAAFGDPGFHEAIQLTHSIPSALEPTAGMRIIVALWDAGRPEQACSRDHPLSGCATVDWSDAESRPNVPAGGVFDNSLQLQLGAGVRTFYLSERGFLADGADVFDPG